MAYTVTDPNTGEKKRYGTYEEAQSAASSLASDYGTTIEDRTSRAASSDGTTATAPIPGGGITAAGGTTGSLAPTSTIRPVARPDRTVTDDGRTVSTWSEDTAPTQAQLNPASTKDPYVDMTAGEETRARLMDTAQQFSPLGLVKKGLNYLANTSENDKIISMVDGQPIYQREDGSTYAFNSLGLPYNTAGPGTLDAVARPDDTGGLASSRRPSKPEEETTDFTDPCPEGYIYDEEQMMCVIDPSAGLSTTPEPMPTYELPPVNPVEAGGTSDYTQAMNTFIPTPLQPAPPSAIDQRLSQLEQALQRSQSTARTGIMGPK
jgi:hypothetical protein